MKPFRMILLGISTLTMVVMGLLLMLILFPLTLLFGWKARTPHARPSGDAYRKENPECFDTIDSVLRPDGEDTVEVIAREVREEPKTIDLGREPRS